MAATALGAASLGYNLATGNYVGAAISAASMLFGGGGGKESSVLQGFRVNGSAGVGGFKGSVTAFDQLGHTWDATGESNRLNSLDLSQLFTGDANPNADTKKYYSDMYGAKTVPVSFTTDADNTKLQGLLSSYLQNQFGNAAAPTPATPLSPTKMPAPGDSNVILAQQNSLRDQAARRGRASTVLTDPAFSGGGQSETLGA